MGFSRQEYWSGFTFLLQGDLPDTGIKPVSPVTPALAGRFLTTAPPMHTIKRTNMWVTGVPEGEEKKNGAESSFEELIAEKFPNLGRHFDIQVCRAQRPPNRLKNRILSWVSYTSPHLCGPLLENYCDPSMLSFFLWFFMFFEDLYCYLLICSSSYLLQSLLTDFKGEIPSITPARDSETFWHFLWIHLLHASCSLLWQNSYLNSTKHQAGC